MHERDYVQDGTPIITVEHLGDHGIVHEDIPMVSDADRNRLLHYSLKPNDIVFSRVGSVDRNSLITNSENGWLFSGRLLRVRPTSQVNPAFLSVYLNYEPTKHKIRKVAVGQTMPSLNTRILSNIQILLPPLPEQKAIASILSTWDSAIEKTQKLIAQKELQKKALMQQLLTGKQRLKGFGQEWQRLKLSQVFKLIRTYSYSRDNLTYDSSDRNHLIIHYGDIHALFENDILDLDIEKRIPYLKSQFSNDTDFQFLKDGDVIMADVSEDYEGVCECVEIINIKSRKVIGGLHTIVLRDYKDVTVKCFRGYLFNSDKILNALRRLATGVSVYGVSKSSLLSIEIDLPPLDEQRAIVNVLAAAEKGIDLLNQKLSLLKEQKRGLMQKLLTGQVRVQVKK